MASTVTAATLEVVISETLSLGGTEYGGTKTLSIGSINEVFKRIVKCVNSQTTTVATFNGKLLFDLIIKFNALVFDNPQ